MMKEGRKNSSHALIDWGLNCFERVLPLSGIAKKKEKKNVALYPGGSLQA